MKRKVVVLGAGFGGLELTTILSDAFGASLDITLIDKSDSFVFGFSKLDIMFGREEPDAVRHYYCEIEKPGVRFRRESILAIDPQTRRVTTNAGIYDADILVVALGADYDLDATPGLAEGGNEFYTVAGAARVREVLSTFTQGHAVIGVSSWPFKCPAAPSETALMLHDYLKTRGVRDACHISLVMPLSSPVPPAPSTSQALLSAFAERGIQFLPKREVQSLDPGRKVIVLDDGSEMPYDLYLGIPVHCAPRVVAESGLTEEGWIPASLENLRTRFPGVYAIGDVARVGVPKVGVFAEGMARVAAASIIAEIQNGPQPSPFQGLASCYIEFGAGVVGRVDMDFLSGPAPVGTFAEPSTALVTEKKHFGSSRRTRWFDT
ncbi:MAG: FAD-dependent pyridine nucleotide-disulfide oxidoreductase [Chthonomonadaceae bacterium]|nr:FAD-dependent pyridine nucleotide-disulfide oxidoreductase [Chthonomonadaceae bacterium]